MNHERTIWNDTQAVSPIFATFVLILVGITGAAGVAEMIGGFSSEVADSGNTREVRADATIEITVGGCDLMSEITEEVAAAYMDAYPGVGIAVQGGGSHAGVVSCGLDAVDVGVMSRDLTDREREDYGDVEATLIGGSAVVVIADPGGAYSGRTITYTELQKLYDTNWDMVNTIGAAGMGLSATIVQRMDACGTEDMMSAYLAFDVDDAIDDNKCSQAYETGNIGVVERVRITPDSVGFVDYGFAVDSGLAEVEILGIVDGSMITPGVVWGGSDASLRGCVCNEITEQKGTHYPTELARPLKYITNGDPDILEDGFIKFAQSPAALGCFDACGGFAAVEIGEYND